MTSLNPRVQLGASTEADAPLRRFLAAMDRPLPPASAKHVINLITAA
ncbi:hypothetical protein FHW96_003949 [Novosphingobium sp. SG751A]|nr:MULTISPECIES: hypothetical protein [unclassified Novosphingobium]NKJ01603.1 hypothetical protein [Novosphingobium sp. SG707]NOW47767.1 hypothetical protein [Novosphingobium sp. SG751A]